MNIPTSDNNPGDIKDPATGTFKVFSSPIEGQAALYNDLEGKMTGNTATGLTGNSSLTDLAKTWAPASDDNQPLQYAANLANKLGVNPDTPIGQLQPRIDDFARAIADNEGYEGPWAGKTGSAPVQLAPTSQPSAGMPSWEKYGLVGLTTALGIGGAFFTGGADLPETAAIDTAILGGEGLAEAGAGEAISSAVPSLMSRFLGGAGKLATTAAKGYAAEKGIQGVEGLLGMNKAPLPVNTPTDTTPPKATEALYKGLADALSGTQTGRVLASSPEGQMGMAANSLYGLSPSVEEGPNGSLSFNSLDAVNRSKSMVSELHNGMAGVLDAEGKEGNLDEVAQAAIENMRMHTPMHEQADAEQHIIHEMNNYKNFADEKGNMGLGHMMRGKSEMGTAAGDWKKHPVSAQRSAMKAISMGFRKTIERHTDNQELFNKAMLEEQKLINGRKVLAKLHGKTAHRRHGLVHTALHKMSDWAAISIGNKIGGPFGAIVGAYVGETLSKSIDKKIGRTLLESPSIKKAIETLSGKSPKLAKILRARIMEYVQEHAKQMQEEIKRREKDAKRAEYQKKKEGILNPPGKPKEEYEPYTPYAMLPTIKMGKKPKSKEAKMYANLPTIR